MACHAVDRTQTVAQLKEAILAATSKKDVTFLSDEILYRFAECRAFDMESAAVRYLRFVDLVQEYNLPFDLTPEVSRGMVLGAINYGKFDAKGRPLMIVTARNLDWSKVTAQDMQKTWFYCVWQSICSSSLAQTDGVVMVLLARGISTSLFKREFHGFVAKAVQQCMPMKVANMFVVDQPWFFSTLIWPLLSQLISAKLRQRIVMVGRDLRIVQAVVPADAIPDTARADFGAPPRTPPPPPSPTPHSDPAAAAAPPAGAPGAR